MKKTRFFVLLFFISIINLVDAQEYTIEFKGGEKKNFQFIYDNPYFLPKFSVGYSFFGFGVLKTGLLSFQLHPVYRINKKLWVDLKFTTAYSRKLDDNIRYNTPFPELFKRTINAPLFVHYALVGGVVKRDKRLMIDQVGNTTYSAKLPRKVGHSLLADAGLVRFRAPIEYDLNSTLNNDTTFSADMLYATSVGIGISYLRHESYKIKTDSREWKYSRYGRIYTYLTYAVMSKYTVNGYFFQDPGNSVRAHYEASDGYEKPSFTKVGWRFGYEKYMGIVNSNFAGIFGFEFGAVPNLGKGKSGTSAPNFFIVHFGIAFGGKLMY